MRALEVTEKLPAALQEAQRNAILSLLSERMLVWLEEMQMNPDKIPMSPAALRFKAHLKAEGLAEGLAEGERKALLTLLGTRGLPMSAEERAAIDGCKDPAKLDQWIVKAVSAGSVAEVLGTNGKPRAAKQRAGK
jgi:hypothetical protein